ncbi:class I SAM-dependent methyltransferase [Stygiolobus caldivivus]|uniref:Uncharacterized protein n=1 Tax=Stygiolobus caldivivus TaxID=2824673 RepID=A0A8D5U7R4_9CREN|nr:class I SAM-dependent methyltransferase [Stygiolobus caldivivus]BCU70878.1 hypothetical protein KN1_21750 [Stygiolobus caldivivus]
MKIAKLLPTSARSLKEINELIIEEIEKNSTLKIRRENVSLSYGKISLISQNTYDLIFCPNLLDGEFSLLSLLSPLIIRDSSFFNSSNTKEPIGFQLRGRSLLIGSPLLQDLITVSGAETIIRTDEEVRAIYPLPFRDEAFDNVVISEVMDYDLVREAFRVTKTGGKGYTIVPFHIDPVDALKTLSIKYRIINAKAIKHFWIIEGVKSQSKRV